MGDRAALVDEGISVLWATAYLDEAERCDEVLLLNEGRLLASGPPGGFPKRCAGAPSRCAAPTRGPPRGAAGGARLPGVVDAMIKGRDIRVLVSREAPPDYLSATPGPCGRRP